MAKLIPPTMASKPMCLTRSALVREDTIYSRTPVYERRCSTSTESARLSEVITLLSLIPSDILDTFAYYTHRLVVHALGHGAYGQFSSYGDWSNLTMACWLQDGAVSEVFTRFSVVVASVGGSESGRDTHGFATKIYSKCGNQASNPGYNSYVKHAPSCLSNMRHKLTCIHCCTRISLETMFPRSSSTTGRTSRISYMLSSSKLTKASQLAGLPTLPPTTFSTSTLRALFS
jgi:hypothetical protein